MVFRSFRFVTTNVRSRLLAYRLGVPRRVAPDPKAAFVGARIRALREAKGMALEDLAGDVNPAFSKGHLSSLERGLVMPTYETLCRLADALEVHVADLVIDPIGGSDREKLIDFTRSIPRGTLTKLVKELGALASKKRKTS
jgi:transcriptional regulator with XRE-family HTH domain